MKIQDEFIRLFESIAYKNYDETYNIYFIVMSATLPKFDKLKISKDDKYLHKKAISLINSPEKYFNHYLFHRTEVKGGIVELYLDDVERIKEYFFPSPLDGIIFKVFF